MFVAALKVPGVGKKLGTRGEENFEENEITAGTMTNE